MSRSRPRVFLAGGDDRSALAAMRSFAARDIPFVVGVVSPRGLVGISRHARGRRIENGPRARAEPDAYAEFVVEVVRRHGVDLVLPLTDSTLLACDMHREAIEREARLAAPPTAAVRNVLDKKVNLETARMLGIPCPDQFELESLEQLPELVAALGFPVVLKDPGPSVAGDRPRLDLSFVVANDERELRRHLERLSAIGAFPVVQRLVRGRVFNVACFAVQGEVVAVQQYWSARRLGGLSVVRELTPPSSDLVRYCESMVRELRWEGAAHLGFFVREDGDVRYMETNGRFWGSLEGTIAAGWDFPYWTYRYFALGESPRAPLAPQAVGFRWRWHYGDLEVLVRYLAGGEDATWVGRSRTRAVREYLAGFRLHPDVFRIDDPLPELAEHVQGVRRWGLAGLRALKRRLVRLLRRTKRSSTTGSGAQYR